MEEKTMGREEQADAIVKFEIFRGSAAPKFGDVNIAYAEMPDAAAAQFAKHIVPNFKTRGDDRVVFSNSKFSLVYTWFKSGYPVALHSHNADCCYYILAGSLVLGDNVIEKGDGFFVPADVPYSFHAGPAGVELLEFRASSNFNIKITTTNEKYWERLGDLIAGRRDCWASEPKPSLV